MTAGTLATELEGFLSGSSGAVVMEDGAVMFDSGQGKYSVSGESNKCLLHLWSEERNVVRRVLDVESKGESLRVTVQRMGQVRPTKLEICRERDARTVSARRKIAGGLSTYFGASAGGKVSGADSGADEQWGGSRAAVGADLFARAAEARAVGFAVRE